MGALTLTRMAFPSIAAEGVENANNVPNQGYQEKKTAQDDKNKAAEK